MGNGFKFFLKNQNIIHYAQNFFDGMAKKIYIKIKNKIN